jgi:hypothetical protein
MRLEEEVAVATAAPAAPLPPAPLVPHSERTEAEAEGAAGLAAAAADAAARVRLAAMRIGMCVAAAPGEHAATASLCSLHATDKDVARIFEQLEKGSVGV